ncbi:TPA: conjugation system SOS inhibitor PsiB [Citrobacter freundii]|nr:conjugation system SOS inhibitor PsiB [Citrobacter freundii]
MSIHHSRLATMTAEEFEAHRAAGFQYRSELTNAVMNAFALPDKWDMNGEFRSEFGGLFPVQVRFTPEHGRFEVVVCSPGEISDYWLVLISMSQGERLVCVHQSSFFDASEISRILFQISGLHWDGYGLCDIMSILKEEIPV